MVSVCQQILNSFNISGMGEATHFKFGKWVEDDRVHHMGDKWSGSRDPFTVSNPLQYFWNRLSYTVYIWQVDRLRQVPLQG